jgi:hypothetical protein
MARWHEDLPGGVVNLIRQSVVAEYATVSSAGVPIDTPTYSFPSDNLESVDLATGIAYPSKAERARKNPKVGLLFEGAADEPVVSIAGHAAVLDGDLQENVDRYLAEVGSYELPGGGVWSVAQKAVWYWTRIIVTVVPLTVRWWESPAAMDAKPSVWNAPAGIRLRPSDPAPPGSISKAPDWPLLPWLEVAERALARAASGHLSVCDRHGYPLPIRVQSWTLADDGFDLSVPKESPWDPCGRATLTFSGVETFIGTLAADGTRLRLRVERALPIFPLIVDPTQVFTPSQSTKENLMRRLTEETSRRGQPVPSIPLEIPQPTEGAKLRMSRQYLLAEKLAGH